MRIGLFALLWLNLRVRWREWRTGDRDGVFLQQMRALFAADVMRPRSAHTLRLVRSNPQSVSLIARRPRSPVHADPVPSAANIYPALGKILDARGTTRSGQGGRDVLDRRW